jgi:prepilin-type processing-associated H-X9-DG protein
MMNHKIIWGTLGFCALALLVLASIIFQDSIGVLFFLVLLVVVIAALLRGMWRGLDEMGAARLAGDDEAVARCRGPFRLYEAGCLVLGAAGLAAFLLPWFYHQPGRAPQVVSLNNVKQLALAVTQYSQDYNETLPGWVQNPNGAYVHNVWDGQIDPLVKSKDIYAIGQPGIRSYSDPYRCRVLTYGINGLLISPQAGGGDADFDAVSPMNPPHPMSLEDVVSPATTILFAELSTRSRFPGEYGMPPNPRLSTWKDGPSSKEWRHAWDGWIDISPRAWVENGGANGSYHPPFANGVTEYGVGRDLYGAGGASYAFLDGHAKFLKIGDTVGLGTTTSRGLKIKEYNCWSPENTNNMWIPR